MTSIARKGTQRANEGSSSARRQDRYIGNHELRLALCASNGTNLISAGGNINIFFWKTLIFEKPDGGIKYEYTDVGQRNTRVWVTETALLDFRIDG